MLKKDPILIVPYGGYCGGNQVFFVGRVIDDEGIHLPRKSTVVSNALQSLRRMESDEHQGVKIIVSILDHSFPLLTDKEGYFTLQAKFPSIDRLESPFQKVEIQAPELVPPIRTTSEISVPGSEANFGVISDIDDTILQTFVTSLFKVRMLYHTFLRHSDSRIAVEGMDRMIQALHDGQSGVESNPIFYVSNSPWNLFDQITSFLRRYELPQGPLFLRDFGMHMLWPSKKEEVHKISKISEILNSFSELPFILIGDSGEHDADYYIRLALSYPGRIKTIYIRRVKDNENAERIKQLIEDHVDVDVNLLDTADEMYQDAVRKGYAK